jgi:hypothetical protein
MSDLRIEHTSADIELLKRLISESIQAFAGLIKTEARNISAYAQSELANSSRIVYSYIVKDCHDDNEKLKLFTDEAFSRYSMMIAEEYSKMVDYRYQTISKGMHSYSDISFALESALTFAITSISPLAELQPNRTLMPDLFRKFFAQALGLLKMLNLGLASEAYSNWRTLHEAECVIKLLVEGGASLQNVYLRHIVYNNAFHHAIESKEETDAIFVELKGNMAKHGLKSKDMKKYIEYGWLYACRTYHESDVTYKLNFRDGLQKAAGLGEYNEYYEMASEMAHSSPIFFYSNNDFFGDLTSVNLSDITIRALGYLDEWEKQSKVDLGSRKIYKEILVNNLKIEGKKEDDTFYTKYKDYLIDDASNQGDGSEEEG